MALTIYHNPRCSKSRQTLQLIEDAGIDPSIVRYLEDPPLPSEILDFADKLDVPVSGLLRRGEPDFKEAADLPDLDDDTALANWLARHPRVLQRPIVVDNERGRAVIGRPPENIHDLLR